MKKVSVIVPVYNAAEIFGRNAGYYTESDIRGYRGYCG